MAERVYSGTHALPGPEVGDSDEEGVAEEVAARDRPAIAEGPRQFILRQVPPDLQRTPIGFQAFSHAGAVPWTTSQAHSCACGLLSAGLSCRKFVFHE